MVAQFCSRLVATRARVVPLCVQWDDEACVFGHTLLDRRFLRLDNHAGFARGRRRHCGGGGRVSASCVFVVCCMIIAFI